MTTGRYIAPYETVPIVVRDNDILRYVDSDEATLRRNIDAFHEY